MSKDALGAILSWMQERQGEAFVIATANDVASLPPELLRKGRFDEVWWVDLPNQTERAEIVAAALRQHGRDKSVFRRDEELRKVVELTEGFTGSEIAALVPGALFAAFADGQREIGCTDLLDSAATITPLSKTMAEKIDRLREWAKGRARPATSTERSQERVQSRRVLDI